MVDLLVIGGGINGAGIARDAAGRGLSVALVERGDLAAATSSASSKLVHGGLRYLEQLEFRLVAEALAEREVLLRVARHLVWPARFVMPHVRELRPHWMVRAGLFLYDHLARRSLLPGSEAVRLDGGPYACGFHANVRRGFAYSDCRVDDARLVVANARDAAERGARILVRTELLAAHREEGHWRARLSTGETLGARAIVNAAGPWVKEAEEERLAQRGPDSIRLVRGSHIVVPRLYEGEHAFLLQNDDRRVVFLIPFEERFTLVGTTDCPASRPDEATVSEDEVRYLCRAVGRYLARGPAPSDVLWRFAGIRPLYDDGSPHPASVTRDYTLRVHDEAGRAPLLSVFGGKITTFRRLAEHALEMLRPFFPAMSGRWTANAHLPGSAFPSRDEARREVYGRYRKLPEPIVKAVFRRHGALAGEVLGDGLTGEHYGAGLTEREVRYFMAKEWARTAADVLWRRTKAGLHLDERARARVAELVGA